MKDTSIARILLFFTFFLLPLATTLAQKKSTVSSFPSLEYERTEVRTIHSEMVGQDFELWISLPRTYHASETRQYPVIYQMDPYRSFSIVKGLTDVLSGPIPLIQEVIIVGVGYGGRDPEAMMKWALGRTRDYTPVSSEDLEALYRRRFADLGMPDAQVKTGGAPRFLDFLSKELIPMIESDYRTGSGKRMFSGYSLGGLLGMYILFHSPDLFNAYFVGSPSINYKEKITFSYESNFAKQNTDLYAQVFMSAGSLEENTSQLVQHMEEQLMSRSYEHLILNTVIFDNEDHASCYPAALSRALSLFLKND